MNIKKLVALVHRKPKLRVAVVVPNKQIQEKLMQQYKEATDLHFVCGYGPRVNAISHHSGAVVLFVLETCLPKVVDRMVLDRVFFTSKETADIVRNHFRYIVARTIYFEAQDAFYGRTHGQVS